MKDRKPVLILASRSAARKKMLQDAGLKFKAHPVPVDERSALKKMTARKTPAAKIAAELAQKKALAAAARFPDALVIGADQVLECGGKIFSKAGTKNDALKKIKQLSGKTHRLVSAVCVVQGKKILWRAQNTARLRMRTLTPGFIRAYGAAAGPALTRAVGGYELERHGAWLFERVEGDYFTVLGLPLLPLLEYLKTEHGLAP